MRTETHISELHRLLRANNAYTIEEIWENIAIDAARSGSFPLWIESDLSDAELCVGVL